MFGQRRASSSTRLLSALTMNVAGSFDNASSRSQNTPIRQCPAGFSHPQVGRDDAPFPGIQRYFVFRSEEWSDGGTEQEVYYTIQCVRHTNRRSGKAGQYAVLSEGGNRFVIDPHMFDRFNDPILQASILRAAEVGELDYSADSAISWTMRPESCRFSALRWRRECRRREGWAGWSR